MESLKIWIKAIRAPFFTASIVPVLIGSAMAYSAGFFSWPLFFLMLIATLCMHAGLNLSNDYFDHVSGNDKANKTVTPFSGGSRVIQEKLISPQKILFASVLFFGVAVVFGFYMNAITSGNVFLVIGAIALFIAFFYTAPPLKLGYNGLGEILVGLGFGTLIVAASYFVQTETVTADVLLASIPIAILVALILLINEFPDYEADRATRKRNWVVLFGKKTAKNIYIAFLSAAYLIVIFEAYLLIIPYWSLITLFTIPLAVSAVKIIQKNYDKIDELLPANKATIALHLVFGLLFAASFVLDTMF